MWEYRVKIRAGVMDCPMCGDEWTHIETAHISARKEDRHFKEIEVSAITGRIDPWADAGPGEEGRRHRISLIGYCEICGHEFAIVFRQHKGQTEVELVDRGEIDIRTAPLIS